MADPSANVSVEREADRPHVAHLRIDAGDLNRMTEPRLRSVRCAVDEVPDGVSVLTVAAAGDLEDCRGLAAGVDLEAARKFSVPGLRQFLLTLYGTVEAFRDAPFVVVCACGDYAVGAGLEIALGADFRVATRDAVLSFPEIDVGLPTVLHGALLPLHVGYADAAELAFLGAEFSGDRAADAGLLHAAPPAVDYAATVRDLTDDLAAKSPAVLRHQKRTVSMWRSRGLEAAVRRSIGPALAAFEEADSAEAMAAFVEGREPSWESVSDDGDG